MAVGPSYEFGDYRFEPFNARLVHHGRVIPLPGKATETLRQLVEHPDVLVTKEALMTAVWADTAVDENNLNQQISLLRKALGQSGGDELIQTVARRGYRFVAPVRKIDAASADAQMPAAAREVPKRRIGRRGLWVATALAVAVGASVAATAVALLGGVGANAERWRQTRPAQLSRAAQERAAEARRRGDANATVQELQLAVQLDPRNARAYGELAHGLQRLRTHASVVTPIGDSPSVHAAARGVEVDPLCGICHGTLAFFLFYHDWQWSSAQAHYDTALQLSPQSHGIRASYAMLLAATGRLREALEQIDLALGDQPYQAGWHAIRATILYLDRRYDDSIAAADRGLAITVAEREPWEWRSRALFQLGRAEEAIKALAEVAFANSSVQLDAAVRQGGRDAGLRMLLEITGDWRSRQVQSWRRAQWRALLHDTEGALAELETAYELRNLNVLYIGTDPVYDNIRAHPRFQRILRGMGLATTADDENVSQ